MGKGGKGEAKVSRLRNEVAPGGSKGKLASGGVMVCRV